MTKIKFLDGAEGKFSSDKKWSNIKVKKIKNPNWTRDEIILALDFYHKNFPNIPDKKSLKIKELSDKIISLGLSIGIGKNKDYRNVNGVFMKLMNFHSCNKDYLGTGLKSVSKLDKLIYDEFKDKKELSNIAKNIALSIKYQKYNLSSYDEDNFSYEVKEGKILSKMHQYRERDSKIVELKKISVFSDKGKLCCEACNFDFNKMYGKYGEGYIECHHITPLSKIDVNKKTKLEDLALLCSNCHRMVHHKAPWLTIKQLRKILRPLHL